jgi:hypothetical protein
MCGDGKGGENTGVARSEPHTNLKVGVVLKMARELFRDCRSRFVSST